MPLFLDALRLALRQLFEPAFLSAVFTSLLTAVGVFALLFVLAVFLSTHFIPNTGWMAWLSWLAGALGGVFAVTLAVWFFLPVSLGIVWMFTDRVSAAVEHRFYPHLPTVTGAGLSTQLASALGLMGKAVLLYALALPTLLIPGLNVVVFAAIGAHLLGRELFESVALRRLPRSAFAALWPRVRFHAWAIGATLSTLALVPVLNLLTPILGIAAMTHVYVRCSAQFSEHRSLP